jgi:hypothetical protein
MKSLRSSARRLALELLETRQLLSTGLQPSATEQLFLEQLNDIRANPAAYGAAIGVDLSGVPPAPPLTIDPLLQEAAQLHAQDMNDRSYFSRTTPEGLDPGQRITAAGFAWTSWGESSAGGSLYATPAEALQALITDAGVSGLTDRRQLLGIDGAFRTQEQVGIGIVQNGSGPLTNYYTIDTATTSSTNPFLTGVVYNDANGNGRFDPGEGLSNIFITVANVGSTATFTSGGYSLQLPPGTYTVTASGIGLSSPLTQTVRIGITNARLNFAIAGTSTQAAQSAWVTMLYQDILGRQPSADEVAGWVGVLAAGASPVAVSQGFLNSVEYAQRLVIGWYQGYLHRAPDATGLAGFTNLLLSGNNETAVRRLFLGSTEYWNYHGDDPTAFVDAVYHDVLGRLPSGTEANGWVTQAAAGDRLGVVDGIAGSQEFQILEVDSFYGTFLRRTADPGGQSYFVSLLSSGQDERAILPLFVGGTEYIAAAPNILWLQNIYRDTLARSGDNAAELGAWLAILNSGTDRVTIANSFLTSAEGDADAITAIYEELLGQTPDMQSLSTWLQQVENGTSLTDVLVTVASSQDYFTQQGGNNSGFILGLYQDLLGRPPSDAEVANWLGLITGGMSRSQIATLFVGSLEYEYRVITELFSLYLRRTPSGNELNQYAADLNAGATPTDVAAALLGSSEYYTRTAW